MKILSGIALLCALAVTNGIELTHANWEAETTGKTVFIKFLAPCKLEVGREMLVYLAARVLA